MKTNSGLSRLQELNQQIQQSVGDASDPKKYMDFYRSKSTIEKQELKQVFFGDCLAFREKVFDVILKNPKIFQHHFLTESFRPEQRYEAFKEVQTFMLNKLFTYDDYLQDPHRVQIAANSFYTYNPASAVKLFGVHFGLYTKSIINLGTEKHTKYIERAVALQDIGSFSLTELGHGSNVKGILTTAIYDAKTNEFIINSPNDLSMKFWIGASAELATMNLCWAQLIIGGKNYGVHGFLVPIRDKRNHQLLPGIQIGDCGPKVGLDGIDNGWLLYKDVRVPYDALLNKFSWIEKGEFKSSIPNDEKRFAFTLGSLSNGRVGLTLSGSTCQILALTIGIRYACCRLQFGTPEQPIIEYQLTQYRMMPLLAKCIACQIGGIAQASVFDRNSHKILDLKNNLITEIHGISSIMKPLSSWWAQQAINETRQLLGGHGYSAFNRLGQLWRDNDVNCTWEGDNNVLVQQAGKFVMDGLQKILKGKENPFQYTQFLTLDPVLGKRCEAKTKEELLNITLLFEALKYRTLLLAQKTLEKLQENFQIYQKPLDTWNSTQVFFIQATGKSFGEVFMAQEYLKVLSNLKSQNNKTVLTKFYYLWVLYTIDNDLGTFRVGDYINQEQSDWIKELILDLCKELVSESIGIIDVLAPPDQILGSPMGLSDGDIYNRYLTYVRGTKNGNARVSWWREIYGNQTEQ